MSALESTKPIKEARYVFEVEWYDQQANILRYYRLFFFPLNNSIEMYDKKMSRVFLKRIETPDLKLAELYIGAKVTVHTRVLHVTEYGDIATANKQQQDSGCTYGMIKPDAYTNFGKIIDAIYKDGFEINKLKMSKFNDESIGEFYGEHVGKPFFPNLSSHMQSDVVIGMSLTGPQAVSKWRDLIGPTNTQKAQTEAPSSLRALFGTDGTKNATHGADSTESADREIDFFFGGKPSDRLMKTTAVLDNCSLCIIKPHIVKTGQLGQVIDMILQAGFEISAAEMFHLSRDVIEEFMDVYKGVLPEYLPLIEHLSNGPSVVLEVRQENVVQAFREFVGPNDPEVAKHLKPSSLRAQFGTDRVKNAVHVTDLPEDGRLECQYFFQVLQAHQ